MSGSSCALRVLCPLSCRLCVLQIWPLVSLINFAWVPPNLQVLFGNVISIFWTAYVVSVTR
jgi:hypothetical protein